MSLTSVLLHTHTHTSWKFWITETVMLLNDLNIIKYTYKPTHLHLQVYFCLYKFVAGTQWQEAVYALYLEKYTRGDLEELHVMPDSSLNIKFRLYLLWIFADPGQKKRNNKLITGHLFISVHLDLIADALNKDADDKSKVTQGLQACEKSLSESLSQQSSSVVCVWVLIFSPTLFLVLNFI